MPWFPPTIASPTAMDEPRRHCIMTVIGGGSRPHSTAPSSPFSAVVRMPPIPIPEPVIDWFCRLRPAPSSGATTPGGGIRPMVPLAEALAVVTPDSRRIVAVRRRATRLRLFPVRGLRRVSPRADARGHASRRHSCFSQRMTPARRSSRYPGRSRPHAWAARDPGPEWAGRADRLATALDACLRAADIVTQRGRHGDMRMTPQDILKSIPIFAAVLDDAQGATPSPGRLVSRKFSRAARFSCARARSGHRCSRSPAVRRKSVFLPPASRRSSLISVPATSSAKYPF